MQTAQGGQRVLGGRYVLGERLGRGAAGEVRAAWDRLGDREVAVKVWSGSDEQVWSRQRLTQEVRLTSSLVSDRIVRVLGYDAGAQPPYLVMERLPGRTWAHVLREHRPADTVAARVLCDVLDALAVAHVRGVVHRDVKPSNVLLDDAGRAKLADFGIAVGGDGDSLSRTGEVIGSPAYLAPERLAGAAGGPACDVWSVAVMAVEAFTGSRPYQCDTPLATALAVVHGGHVPLGVRRPDLPAALTEAVEAALDPDPARRPSVARLRTAIGTMLAPVAVPVPAQARRALRPHVRLMAPLAVAAALLGGAAQAVLGVSVGEVSSALVQAEGSASTPAFAPPAVVAVRTGPARPAADRPQEAATGAGSARPARSGGGGTTRRQPAVTHQVEVTSLTTPERPADASPEHGRGHGRDGHDGKDRGDRGEGKGHGRSHGPGTGGQKGQDGHEPGDDASQAAASLSA